MYSCKVQLQRPFAAKLLKFRWCSLYSLSLLYLSTNSCAEIACWFIHQSSTPQNLCIHDLCKMQDMQSRYHTFPCSTLAIACFVMPFTVPCARVCPTILFKVLLHCLIKEAKCLVFRHLSLTLEFTILNMAISTSCTLPVPFMQVTPWDLTHYNPWRRHQWNTFSNDPSSSTYKCKQVWKVRRMCHGQSFMHCTHVLGATYKHFQKRKRFSTALRLQKRIRVLSEKEFSVPLHTEKYIVWTQSKAQLSQ